MIVWNFLCDYIGGKSGGKLEVDEIRFAKYCYLLQLG